MSESAERKVDGKALAEAAPRSIASESKGVELPEVKKQNPDQPLRIIEINDQGSEFSLQNELLEQVLKDAAKINPKKVIVVSVVGAFRTGKSFLLDLFLRYLYYTERTGSAPPMMDKDPPVWLTESGPHLNEGSDKDHPGFLWRPGKDRTTTGIWMYGRPFTRVIEGEKVPVLLMDTQGMFDFQTRKELTAAIFGLSTLMSSVQIYNLSKQIQEDKIEQLHYFTEFARVAYKEAERAIQRQAAITKSESKTTSGEPPFQKLCFLVRDWQNFEDEKDVEKCLAEMNQALDEAMNKAQTDDSGTRDQIREAFGSIESFLLPHPGIEMTAKAYDGKISLIRLEFLRLLDRYIHDLFENGLCLKRVNGKDIGPEVLGMYFRDYGKIFRDGKMPKQLTLVKAMAQTTNLVAKDNALEIYLDEMKKLLGRSHQPESKLSEFNSRAKQKSYEFFDSQAVFGDTTEIVNMRQDLTRRLVEEFERISEINRRRLHEDLERWVVPVLAAVVALILDTVTDWTCDAWSEMCRSSSKLFALVYYIVTVIVGFQLYQIYKRSGTAAAGMGAMALGTATLQKVEEFNKKVPIDSWFRKAKKPEKEKPE